MTKQAVNIGTSPAGTGGDTARGAFEKINSNFDEIFSSGGSAANAKALNGLSGAAGKFPAFTGNGQMRIADIVGVVAQSSGIPTGALCEYGYNANGQYYRFAGGLQICFKFGISVALSGSVIAFSVAYPAAFGDIPVGVGIKNDDLSAWSSNDDRLKSIIGYRTTGGTSFISGLLSRADGNNFYGENGSFGYIAFGRWHL